MADTGQWSRHYHAGAHRLDGEPSEKIAPAPAPIDAARRRRSSGGGGEGVGTGLSWENLSWYAKLDNRGVGACACIGPGEKRVLHGLTGHAPRGHLVAVLGPSGSGKTTLLDILAMRKTVGRTTGAVRINGQERRQKAFQRATAFILQQNVLLPTMTVGETMHFYAEMMLPHDMATVEKRTRAADALRLVGLSKNESVLVGGSMPGGYHLLGLSSGQQKRLSIATEMLPKPVLVFADEPTSGIDAFASLRVLEVLKEVAESGKTVVATLHQPRDAIWKLIDEIYLMSEGRLMYAGPPSGAPAWFKSIGYEAPHDISVSDWLLDVVTIGFDKDEIGWKCMADVGDIVIAATHFASSNRFKNIQDDVTAALGLATREGRAKSLWPALGERVHEDHAAFVPRLVQTQALLKRHIIDYSRNLGNVLARLLLSLVAGVLVGICYIGLRSEDHKDPRSLVNRVGSLFFCCLILMMSPNCSMGLFMANRRFYSVEAAAHMYNSLSYYVPMAACEITVNLLAAAVFWAPVCVLSGAGQGTFTGFLRGLLACGLLQLCGSQITNFCALLLPNQELAFVSSVAINIVAFITGGFLIKTSNLPAYASWLRYLSPAKYGLHVLVFNEVTDRSFDMKLQLERLDDAVHHVGLAGCSRETDTPSWRVLGAVRAVLGDVLDSIDPCLFGTVRDGGEALACLQLDEPSATTPVPSLLILLSHVFLLHLLGWLCLRHLHKEKR